MRRDLITAANNGRLVDMWEILRHQIDLFGAMQAGSIDGSKISSDYVREHMGIVDAIAAEDEARAIELLAGHSRHQAEEMLQFVVG